MGYSQRHCQPPQTLKTLRILILIAAGYCGLMLVASDALTNEILLGNDNFTEHLHNNHTPVNGDYRLAEDIDLGAHQPWPPIGNFTGSLDGDGHIISGLNISTHTYNTYTGLFGYAHNCWLRQVVFDRPQVLSTGGGSPAGVWAGSARNCNLTDTVIHLGSVRTEGNGFNDIFSGVGSLLGEGRNCYIANCLNTATVNSTGYFAITGGFLGYGEETHVTDSLNTGAVRSEGDDAYTGGLEGLGKEGSHVNSSLNTGSVSSSGTRVYTGGLSGANSLITTSLNTGTVSTEGPESLTGGIKGGLWVSQLNTLCLNTGTVSSTGNQAHTGGLAGSKGNKRNITLSVNAGSVSSSGFGALTGSIAGEYLHDPTDPKVYGNINIASVTASNSSYTNHFGQIPGSLADLKNSDTQILSNDWVQGSTDQYPIPKALNAPWRDLRRINGTRYGNNDFPAVLLDFADPGGDRDASIFDQTVWNVRDGHLPFLKKTRQQAAEQRGIDCSLGGYACTPAFYARPLFIDYIGESDYRNERIYIVAYEPHSHQLLLTRYTDDGELDIDFGINGAYHYPATGLSPSFAVTAGTVYQHQQQRHLSLFAHNNGTETEIRLNLSQPAQAPMLQSYELGAQARVYGVTSEHSVASRPPWFTGTVGGNLLLGNVVSGQFMVDDSGQDMESGQVVWQDSDNSLVVAGSRNNQVLLRKYNVTGDTDAWQAVPDFQYGPANVQDNVVRRGQALYRFHQTLYLTSHQQPGPDLLIERYGLDGYRDPGFMASSNTTMGNNTSVVYIDNKTLLSLRVYKYLPGQDRVALTVFDRQGLELARHMLTFARITELPALALAFASSGHRIYFTGQDSQGELVLEVQDLASLALPTGGPLPTDIDRPLVVASTTPSRIFSTTAQVTSHSPAMTLTTLVRETVAATMAAETSFWPTTMAEYNTITETATTTGIAPTVTGFPTLGKNNSGLTPGQWAGVIVAATTVTAVVVIAAVSVGCYIKHRLRDVTP